MTFVRWAVWLSIPVALVLGIVYSNPFATPLTTVTLSMQTLSTEQKTNVRLAAKRLDGLVLQDGEIVSFNRVVGPRTEARGYRPAPSYVVGDSPVTLGGGICLLSSALYQLGLSSGLKVRERVAHLRTIHSVPPGLDATVWYGGADLKLENALHRPLQLQTLIQSNTLTLRLLGRGTIPHPSLVRQVRQAGRQAVMVTVLQDGRLLSRDLYRLSR